MCVCMCVKAVPEGRARLSATSLPVITSDRLARAKALVEKAIKVRLVMRRSLSATLQDPLVTLLLSLWFSF